MHSHCPILPAARDGQRLRPLHIPWRRVIRGRRSLRRGPRSWAHIFWGAAEMRRAQIQFHGTYKESAKLLTSQAAAADVTGCLSPQRTGLAYFIRKHACMYPVAVRPVLGLQLKQLGKTGQAPCLTPLATATGPRQRLLILLGSAPDFPGTLLFRHLIARCGCQACCGSTWLSDE